MKLLAVTLGYMALALSEGRGAQFQDVTVSAGVTNAPGYCLSAAWGDYNNDQFIDLYLAIGADTSRVNALFRNNHDGTFTRVGSEAGPITTDSRDSQGCAWIDFDNDGHRDMFVVNGGWSANRNSFYWNNGNGTFRSANVGDLTQLSRYRGWASCADYDGDGWVDVQVGEGTAMWGPYPKRVYHNTGLGSFTPVDFASPEGYINGGVWGDYDNDGDPDLFLSCYSSASRLYRNDGGGHFTLMSNGLPTGGNTMHAAWGDYDRDGDLDIALCAGEGTRIFRNDGMNGFASAATLPAAKGWGAWVDYDNDGLLDFFASYGQGGPQKAALYRNNGNGTFTSVSETMTAPVDNWLPAAWGDFDNNGFMDVVMTHQNGQHRLYRNLGNTNHWTKFKLVGTASNRDAIGAKVRIQATIAGQSVWQMQEVNGGYCLQNDTWLNFGLGDATNVDQVRIEWPSGIVQLTNNLAPGQILTVTEHQEYSGPLPAFAGASATPTGFVFSIAEPAEGVVYSVEASTNLVSWSKLMVRKSTNVTSSFTDTAVTNRPQRFYRVVVP